MAKPQRTEGNLASQYSKLGRTHDKRYVAQEILSLFQNKLSDSIKSPKFLADSGMCSNIKSLKNTVKSPHLILLNKKHNNNQKLNSGGKTKWKKTSRKLSQNK
jgi:hypothetical protein